MNCNKIIIYIIIIIYLYKLYYKLYYKLNYKDLYTIIYNNPHITINTNRNIAIVTLYTPNLSIFANEAIKNYKYYCNLHNYALYVFNQALSPDIEKGCWNKIPAILEILKKKQHKYVIWIDIDAIFNNPSISFVELINSNKDSDIIVCKDPKPTKYIFNSGIIICKNTNWTTKIFNDTWNYPIIHGYGKFGDQVILSKVIKKNAIQTNQEDINNIHKKVIILPERTFNSYPNKYTFKNDFILHFMGCSYDYRKNKFIEINKKLGII